MLSRASRFAANNAIALVALFLALGGASYAATGAFKASTPVVYKACVGGSKVVVLKTGPKPCGKHKRTITWNQTGPAGPQGASGVAGVNGVATKAETATNALNLGGTPASEFVHRDCASITGQIKGFASIPEGTKPENFTAVQGYNCSGKEVEYKSPAFGIYIFKFVGSPTTIAMATATGSSVVGDYAMVHLIAPGEFEVGTFNHEGIAVAAGVELLLP